MYGMRAIFDAALSIIIPKIPPELRNSLPDNHVHGLIPQFIEAIKTRIKDGDPYDTFYVTSFAQGRNEHEEDNGILTLWRAYTQTAGYCLQYNRNAIESLLHTEQLIYSYGILQLADVVYGIDQDDAEFKYLAQQYATILLIELAKATGDSRFMDGMPMPHPQGQVVARLLLFCGKHKHPSFIDEREVRIFAFPLNKVIPQFFRPTLSKPVHTNPDTGHKYLNIGENRSPALRPERVIIGPNADLEESAVKALFPESLREITPKILKSDIPIRPE